MQQIQNELVRVLPKTLEIDRVPRSFDIVVRKPHIGVVVTHFNRSHLRGMTLDFAVRQVKKALKEWLS